MSGSKREIERLEGLRQHAIGVLKENNAIIVCPECEGHDINNLDDDGVKSSYAQVTNEFKRGEIDGSLQEIRDKIREALADTNIECPDCERDLRD